MKFRYQLGMLNGVAIGLAYTLVNNALAVLVAFGATLNTAEIAQIMAFTNTALLLVAYLTHNSGKYSRTVLPAQPMQVPQNTIESPLPKVSDAS